MLVERAPVHDVVIEEVKDAVMVSRAWALPKSNQPRLIYSLSTSTYRNNAFLNPNCADRRYY